MLTLLMPMFLHVPVTGETGCTCPIAYEVITHQAITREAISRAGNLDRFLRDFDLLRMQYSGTPFADLLNQKFRDDNIVLRDFAPRSLVEAGSVLEDQYWRFLRHFMNPQASDQGLKGRYQSAREWALTDGSNEFQLGDALGYYCEAVTGQDEATRRQAQERLFVTMGHLVHLVQDLHQPCHTRDDSHSNHWLVPDGRSELEIWGRRALIPGNLPASVRAALPSGSQYYGSAAGYFDAAAELSSERFLSDDTDLDDYPHPAATDVSTRADTIGGQMFLFLISNLLNDPANPSVRQRLARVNRGLFGESYTLQSPGNVVLIDHAESLIPSAVSKSAGLIDFFFRGRLQLRVDPTDTGTLLVKNISNTSFAPAASDLAFDLSAQSGFTFHYETVDGTIVRLPDEFFIPPLTGDLLPGEEVPVAGDLTLFFETVLDPGLPPSVRARPDRRVVALYDGFVGGERGVAAGRVSFVQNVSLLLSYDVSGSVSIPELEAAKQAGISLVPLLAGDSSNRASLHSFSSSAHVNLEFTDDIAALAVAIEALSPGGSTALYDAIALAGSKAATEANTSSNRTIVILFTDGGENASSASLPQAVAAISSAVHPEIDEVFLVFVGGATSGAQALSNIAAQAGRQFYDIADFDDLTAAFLALLQGSS